jgi:hypothetical protein
MEILGRLSGEVTVFQPLTIVEVSMGGVQVETDFPLTAHTVHDFRISLGAHTLVIKGRVTHCRLADVDHERVIYRTGVEILDPSPHVREAFEAYIDELKGTSTGPSVS